MDGLTNDIAELDQGGRRWADLKVITTICERLPTSLVRFFLDEALQDRVHHEILTETDPSADLVNSLSFQLYDRKLLLLFRAFFNEWVLASASSEGIYHDYEGEGVATLLPSSRTSEDIMERRKQFHIHIVKANESFIELTAYVKQSFPQFDIDESDKAGVRRYQDRMANVDREIGDIAVSLRNHRRVSKSIELNDYL